MSSYKIESLTELDEFLENNDNSRNIEYISAIPQICKNEPCLLGVDEAGRGPVLGPMVYGIAFCPLSKLDQLKTLECADSKSLTEEKRDSIFSKLCTATDFMGWAVEVISPNIISNNMEERSKINLNKISMDSAIKLIKLAQKSGADISEVYVDTVGKPEKYEAYLTGLFPGLKIKVSKKADALFPIVSAASICAKVSRDHSLQVWKFSEDMELAQKEFGSGYPGDPVTKKFLVDYADPVFGYPRLVRFSWSSTSTALVDKACTVDWSDVEEEDDNTSHTPVISSFFKNNTSAKKFSHPFFIDRNLSSCDTL